jgi:hypothetical protein
MLLDSVDFKQMNPRLNGDPFAFFTHTYRIRSNEVFMMPPDKVIEYWKDNQEQQGTLCLCYTTNVNPNIFKGDRYSVVFIFDELNPANVTNISPINSCSNSLLLKRSQTLYSPVTFAKLTRAIGERKGEDNFNEVLYKVRKGEALMPKAILRQGEEPDEIDYYFSNVFGIPIICQSTNAYLKSEIDLATPFEPKFFN